MTFPLISPDWDFALWAVLIGVAGTLHILIVVLIPSVAILRRWILPGYNA